MNVHRKAKVAPLRCSWNCALKVILFGSLADALGTHVAFFCIVRKPCDLRHIIFHVKIQVEFVLSIPPTGTQNREKGSGRIPRIQVQIPIRNLVRRVNGLVDARLQANHV